MDNNPVTPPSLIGAGVATQPQPPQSLIGALRSQGSMPAEAMAQMTAPQASPGLGFGSGVLAAAGGHPGQNPYLAQQAQQAQQGQQQSMQMAQLAQKKQAMDAERAMQQNKALLSVADGLMASDDPDKSQKGAVFMGQILKKMGADVDPEFIKALGNKDLTGPSLAKVVGLYDEGLSPEKIAEATGYSPMAVMKVKSIADSDMIRTAMKIPTRIEARGKVRDEQKKTLELAFEEYGLGPKNPRTPFAAAYTLEHFGVNFAQATPEQRKEAIAQSAVLATKADKPTAEMRNAMAEFNPQGDINNPADVRKAMSLKRARTQKDMLDRGAQQGQLSVIGRQYSDELKRISLQQDKMRIVDGLVAKMDRLLDEGQGLGLMDNPKAMNALQNELIHWTGGPKSKGAQWLEAFNTLDAQFASVAQGIEGITGNRLAQQNVTRALAFHPKASNPLGVNRRVVQELKRAVEQVRDVNSQEAAAITRKYSSAAGAAGVPFILGGGEDAHGAGSWSAEPEEE